MDVNIICIKQIEDDSILISEYIFNQSIRNRKLAYTATHSINIINNTSYKDIYDLYHLIQLF